MGHTYTHTYIYIYIHIIHIYIYYIYIHTTRIQGVWNDWTDTVDVCHFLWLFYDGGSLCYIIQPICVYVLDCLSLSLPHYIPMIFPKMVIRLNYLKFLCYTYNMTYIWLYILLIFPYVPILSNESTFFSKKRMGRSRPCPEDATVMSCSEPWQLRRGLEISISPTGDVTISNWLFQ